MVIYCRIKVSTLEMFEKGIEGVLFILLSIIFYYFEKNLYLR
ncbi:hypothetical protein HMPREF9108_00658 [Leptotrichia sp. oral taxon 225 str. F0581]|nr:hypothetical protein HMPREF9108_00658 [Leptotrichia sp. oral taxon 225 str. F0581]